MQDITSKFKKNRKGPISTGTLLFIYITHAKLVQEISFKEKSSCYNVCKARVMDLGEFVSYYFVPLWNFN